MEGEINIPVNVDVAKLDEAITKANKLVELLKESNELAILPNAVIINVESADCFTRHMQAFLNQSDKRVADFGEPCVGCKHAEVCKYDWLGKMQPLFYQSDEEFSVCASKE